MTSTRFSDIDEYGFRRPDDFDYQHFEVAMSSYLSVLTKRQIRWMKFAQTNDFSVKSSQLKRFIRKGVPSHLRGEVWMKSSGAFMSMLKQPGMYQSLLSSQYDQDIVESIKIDLPRTFPDNIFFDNIKHQLFNVLVAFAHHNKDVGYCQGLNYIAGLLLIATHNEEWTFWLLKELIENIVPSYHTKTMTGLINDIDVMAELIKARQPVIQAHINNLGLPWAVIATKWFICLYAEVFPVETVLRIWDCLFSEGYKILFRVGITLIVRSRQEILATQDMASLADLFKSLCKGPMLVNCHEFMQSIFTVPGTIKRSQIEHIRLYINEQRLRDKNKPRYQKKKLE